MKAQTTFVPPVMLSQAEEEIRMALRPLLRALVRAPGSLYNPAYVGPLRRPDPLRLEIVACLDDGRRGDGSAAEPGVGSNTPELVEPAVFAEQGARGPAVLVASVREAQMLLKGGMDLGDGLQLIIWGTEKAEELPPFVQGKLEKGGLSFDPSEHRGLVGGWSMGSAISRAIESGNSVPNPIVVVGSATMLSVLSSEAQLRLEVADVGSVPIYSHGEVPDDDALAAMGEGSAVVLRLAESADAEARARILEVTGLLVGQGVLVVMIVDVDVYSGFGEDPRWRMLSARSTRVMAVEETGGDGKPWPTASQVLLGAPLRAAEVAQTLSFNLDSVPLDELLQLADVWRRSGHFVLYNESRLGWIEVRGDMVLNAVRYGDPEGLSSSEIVTARIRSMAGWDSGQVVFVPASDAGAERDGMPLNALAFDLTRMADERRTGKVMATHPDVPEMGPLKPYQVAEGLLRWGLGSAAMSLLQRAERQSGWGVEEDLLLGHLSAERDPQEAVARLRHGVFRLASEEASDAERMALQIDATLNALLLEVRGGQVRPSAGWLMIERWLDTGGDAWVSTEKHAAILFELAVRARQDDAAQRFWDCLVRMVGANHPLVRELAIHRTAS